VYYPTDSSIIRCNIENLRLDALGGGLFEDKRVTQVSNDPQRKHYDMTLENKWFLKEKSLMEENVLNWYK